jgi:hypothetical protein
VLETFEIVAEQNDACRMGRIFGARPALRGLSVLLLLAAADCLFQELIDLKVCKIIYSE